MFRTSHRSIGLLTTLLMAFTAIWCCCAPAHATATQTHVVRDCCERPQCPAGKPSSDGCPIIQVRESSVAPLPAVVPATPDLAMPLPVFLTPVPVIADANEIDRVACDLQTTGPPTLLALHTSLLW